MKNTQKLETLDMDETTPSNIQDIHKPFFQPIEEVQEKQEELINNYEQTHAPDNTDMKIPDLSDDVRILEQKLAKKKNSVPLLVVILLVLAINLAWFAAVQLWILPKCENCIQVQMEQ